MAEADLHQLLDYIEGDSLQAALSTEREISLQIERLTQFPDMGRPGRIAGMRELIINRTPYIAAYRIVGNTLRILRILHGAQQWPGPVDWD